MTVLSLYSPVNLDMAESYGLFAIQLALELRGLGVTVNLCSLGKRVVANQPPALQALLDSPIVPSVGGIVMGYPDSFAYHSSMLYAGPRIALTMFESSRLPAGWRDPLNACTAVIVPSTFCAES